MSRSTVGKLMLLTKKLERSKVKLERRIDNLKRQYVATLDALNKLDAQVLALLEPKMKEAKKELAKIEIPVVPADATLNTEV
jgi:hypothetical protein